MSLQHEQRHKTLHCSRRSPQPLHRLDAFVSSAKPCPMFGIAVSRFPGFRVCSFRIRKICDRILHRRNSVYSCHRVRVFCTLHSLARDIAMSSSAPDLCTILSDRLPHSRYFDWLAGVLGFRLPILSRVFPQKFACSRRCLSLWSLRPGLLRTN
jgi:hypothetical protein